MKSVYVHSLAHPVRSKINLVSPAANHAPVALLVMRVPPVVCWMLQVVRLVPMPVVQPQFVILVVVENTTIKLNKRRNPVAKTAIPDVTKTKLDKHRAGTIVPVHWCSHRMQDVLTSECTRNARVACVATVVVLAVTLPRPPRVERGRRRWVGVIRRRILCHRRTLLPGVLLLLLGPCTSTPTTQTSPAAPENVSAH